MDPGCSVWGEKERATKREERRERTKGSGLRRKTDQGMRRSKDSLVEYTEEEIGRDEARVCLSAGQE